MLKSGLHIHTKEDPWDIIKYNAKELINKASKLNFDVLSIANHLKITYNQDLKNYAKRKNILLIPGAEIKIQGKEVLVYNTTNEQIKKIKDFNDLEKIRQNNALICAPHPFFIKSYCLGEKLIENIHLFDAIEFCFFYNKIINRNRKAIRVAEEFNKPIIANSDSHKLWQFGRNYSLIDSEKSVNSFFEAIRKKKIEIVTKPLSLHLFIRALEHGLFPKRKSL